MEHTKTMKDEIFNKEKAFEELTEIQTIKGEVTLSKAVKVVHNTADYLQHIYDTAFAKGFEAGLNANEKINNYAIENPNL